MMAEIREHVSVTVVYEGGPDDTRLQHTVSWDEVPDQNKAWERVKQMIDVLYTQVR